MRKARAKGFRSCSMLPVSLTSTGRWWILTMAFTGKASKSKILTPRAPAVAGNPLTEQVGLKRGRPEVGRLFSGFVQRDHPERQLFCPYVEKPRSLQFSAQCGCIREFLNRFVQVHVRGAVAGNGAGEGR